MTTNLNKTINTKSQQNEMKLTDSEEKENIAGLDNIPDVSGWGKSFPIDSVLVRPETRSASDMIRLIDDGRIIMDPDFQRDFVWEEKRQSKLIESCLMRIPLPVFYVAENEDGKLIIVDGLQRLKTLDRFLNNNLKLSGLGDNSELNGMRYRDLQAKLQENVRFTQLTFHILDKRTPEIVKLQIFDRVNSGKPLTRQQMRNALYTGVATQWLKDVTDKDVDAFHNATGSSFKSKSMRDREAVNRFISFYLLGFSNYGPSGDMDKFLADGLLAMQRLDESERVQLRVLFELTMRLCYQLFGEHSFRKSMANRDIFDKVIGRNKTVINISLFDVMSVTFAKLLKRILRDLDLILDNIHNGKWETLLENVKNKEYLAQIVKDLLKNNDFKVAVTLGTNNKDKVTIRHEKLESALNQYYEKNYVKT